MKPVRFSLGTILCSFTKGIGWRVVKTLPTVDRRIRIVRAAGLKVLSIPVAIGKRRGQFCNPAELALDFISNGNRKTSGPKFPIVLSHRSFSAFMNNYRAGVYGSLRLGLAFYHEYSLYKVEQQRALDQIWRKDGDSAVRSIKTFTRFVGDDEPGVGTLPHIFDLRPTLHKSSFKSH